jgi:hypothetical protein
MSGTDIRLRELLAAAVGEPPTSVSVARIRRLARRRRARHGIGAASTAAAFCAAVAVLASGLAVPLFGHPSSPRPTSSARTGHVPRYYIQEQGTSKRALVRDTATGVATAAVRCPWAGATIQGIAPSGDGAFFLDCQQTSRSSAHPPVVSFSSRIYRFKVTSAGSVPDYSLLPGGAMRGLATYGLTAAADGSEVAMQTALGRAAAGVVVINTRTGAHALWRGMGQDFTLSPNGRELRFVISSGAVAGRDIEVRQVGPASRGGRLSSARVLVNITSRRSGPRVVFYARVSPEGSVLTLAALQYPVLSTPQSVATIVEQVSVASGRVIRVLFRADARGGFNAYAASSDPTGQYIILNYSPINGVANGWLDHGHLVPLKPAHASDLYEIW